DLDANTLLIIPDKIVEKYGKEYAMNIKIDLIKQTENKIAYNKSVGQPTEHDEKALTYLNSIHGKDIKAFSEILANNSEKENSVNKQSKAHQNSETAIEKFLNDLREKGAVKFLAELDKEKIEEQIDEYRKGLEEKYKDNPEMMAKIDELVEKFKKQLIEKIEEKIKQDTSDATKKAEASIAAIKDMKSTTKSSHLEEIIQNKDEKTRIQEALQRIKKAENASPPELIQGYDLKIKFGMMALGGEKQIDMWKSKGLEITEKTLLEASKIYNAGFKALYDRGASPLGGVAYNHHKIVMNFQDTPKWFEDEFSTRLSQLQEPIRKEYEQGALFYIS
ncbi:MAG: hypothetical protein P8Y16_04350, partial [Sulfurimonas sp.]